MAAADRLRAFAAAGVDVAEHFLHVRGRNERTHFGFRIEAVADHDPRARFGETREKFVSDLFVEDEPGARAAHLTLAGENREHGVLERDLEIRVGKDDAR